MENVGNNDRKWLISQKKSILHAMSAKWISGGKGLKGEKVAHESAEKHRFHRG